MKRKAYSRGERVEQILNQFYSMAGDGYDPFASAYSMARLLGLNSAQNVRNIMNQMVDDGMLSYINVEHRKGVTKRLYCPLPLIPIGVPETGLEPTFRINGKQV